MNLEPKDILQAFLLLATIVSVVVVNRNARRATAVNAENVDLARIRDLRSELTEAKVELDVVKRQVGEMMRQTQAANDAAYQAVRDREEMLRYGRMPGMDIERWLARFGDDRPQRIGG